jgi:hypothetical protein
MAKQQAPALQFHFTLCPMAASTMPTRPEFLAGALILDPNLSPFDPLAPIAGVSLVAFPYLVTLGSLSVGL